MSTPSNPLIESLPIKTALQVAAQLMDAIDALLKGRPMPEADKRAIASELGAVVAKQTHAIGLGAGAIINLLAPVAAGVLTTITQAKNSGQSGIHDLIVAALSDVLQIELTNADVPVGEGAAAQKAVNTSLGAKFLEQIKTLFGGQGVVNGDTAEKGAEAFLGFGMQFSASVGFLGLLGELFSLGQIKEVAEIGEMLERSLGLGRLTRQVLKPLIRNTIEQPYDRKLRAQYRQDILSTGELTKAIFRQSPLAQRANGLLTEHGLSDDQIAELIDQQRPKISAHDLELLSAWGAITPPGATAHAQTDGIPPEVSALLFQALQIQRLNRIRDRVLSEVLSQINQGFLPASALDSVLSQLGIPADEQTLWRQAAGYAGERLRKRLNQGDMLFLYEAAQITLSEVQQWAEEEGYSPEDQQRLVLFFALKAASAAHSKTGGAAAKTAHAHIEHVAYVTDEITGLFGRAPTAAEVSYWVGLLDQGDRSKHDFVTELKNLPTTGPAVPPGAAH